MRIGIIGAGAMGSALAKALKSRSVAVYDRNPEKAEALHPATTCHSIEELALESDLVILAIKPQSFKKLSRQTDLEDKLIVSVMAGITIAQLELVTGSKRIVRCMPNLGVQVGTGVSGWIATPAVSKEEKTFIQEILSSTGVQIEVKKEEHLNIVTAISGSGPAYFFHLAEVLLNCAQEMGLPEEQARLLTEGTLRTSADLIAKDTKSAREWKHEIMVPGGTTEAAIHVFENNAFDKMVLKAVKAAHDKAEELT